MKVLEFSIKPCFSFNGSVVSNLKQPDCFLQQKAREGKYGSHLQHDLYCSSVKFGKIVK